MTQEDTTSAVVAEQAVTISAEEAGEEADGRGSPPDAAEPPPVPSEEGGRRTVQALVHSPFQPIAYLLVDENLLMPARWPHESRAPARVGDRVTVQIPDGTPQPRLLPLSAFPAESDQSGEI